MLDGSISSTQLTELVQFSRSIVQSHLEHLRPSITRLCLQQGLTITDLAYDCIADAFARDESGRFINAQNFVSHLREELQAIPELELFLAFKAFIVRIAETQLARLYAQCDPAGAKIHRNIRDRIRENDIFLLERDFRGLVLRPRHAESLNHLEAFPLEELERALLARNARPQSTIDFLQILCYILCGQSQYRRSLPLIDVVQLFKIAYQAEAEPADGEVDHFSLDRLTEFEIERLRSQVELTLKEKILLTYFARGKVNRREAEAMFDAFHEMLGDWCNAGSSQCSIQDYFLKHFPVAEDTYERSYRAKMEYLVKVAREEFAARLVREL
jgi:hypothetical protein